MEELAIIKDFKKKGIKVTRARSGLVDIFLNSSHPVSVPEILKLLNERGLKINKTTIYRELEFLVSQQLVRQVDLRERGARFEYDSKTHHHHLICLKCKKVEDFELAGDLTLQEKLIENERHFKVLNHSLEFFGICSNCNQKSV